MTVTRFLLDTNTCIYIINRRPAKVFERFVGLHIGEIAISSITGAELAFGVAKIGSQRNQHALDKFLAPLEILPFDETAMRRYGVLRSDLERRGTPIGALDLLISSTCPVRHGRPQPLIAVMTSCSRLLTTPFHSC